MFFCQSQSTLVALSISLHACNVPAQGLAKRTACEKLNPTRAAPAREPESKFLTFLYCARVLSASGRLHPSKHAKKATLHYNSMTCTPSELTKKRMNSLLLHNAAGPSQHVSQKNTAVKARTQARPNVHYYLSIRSSTANESQAASLTAKNSK